MVSHPIIFAGVDISSGRKPITYAAKVTAYQILLRL